MYTETNIFVFNIQLVYTIAYGSPEIKDGSEGKKVFLGTVGFLAASVGLFAFLRSFGTNIIILYHHLIAILL